MSELDNLPSTDDDRTLRVWDGDESALGELLLLYGATIERIIARQFPNLKSDAEDIVAEAYRRFWQSRQCYDGKLSIKAYLLKIAVNVARSLASGHLGWQKARNLEQQVEDALLQEIEGPSDDIENALDDIEKKEKGICKALRESLKILSHIERAVIEAYAVANGVEIRASALGVELGTRHFDGVPIPAGTIRQHKLRAKNKLIIELRKRGYELENIGVSK